MYMEPDDNFLNFSDDLIEPERQKRGVPRYDPEPLRKDDPLWYMTKNIEELGNHAGKAPKQITQSLLSKAHQLLYQNRYDEAIEAYTLAMQQHKSPAFQIEAADGIIICLKRLKRYNEAVDIINSFLKQNPNRAPHWLFELAQMSEEILPLSDVIPLYRSVLQLNPCHPTALFRLGRIFYKLGKLHQANFCFDATKRLILKMDWDIEFYKEIKAEMLNYKMPEESLVEITEDQEYSWLFALDIPSGSASAMADAEDDPSHL